MTKRARLTTMYGLELVVKMLRFSLGVIKTDRIGYEYVGWTAQVDQFGDKLRQG